MDVLEEKDWPEELVQYLEEVDQKDAICQEYKQFKDGCSFEEYCKAVKKVLMNCGYNYNDEQANKLIEEDLKWLENSYASKVPPSDIAIDIGYCCG